MFINIIHLVTLFQVFNIYELSYLLIETIDEAQNHLQSRSATTFRSLGKTKRYGEKCGQVPPHSAPARIIGGTEITPHSEPWLVSICEEASPR